MNSTILMHKLECGNVETSTLPPLSFLLSYTTHTLQLYNQQIGKVVVRGVCKSTSTNEAVMWTNKYIS